MSKILTTLTIISLAAATTQLPGQTVVSLNSNSGYINSELDGSNPVLETPATSSMNFVGAMGGNEARQIIIGFDLPVLTDDLDTAVITFDMRSTEAVSSNPWFNVDAYAFTSTPTAADVFIGANDASKTLVQDNLLTTAVTNGQTIAINVTSFVSGLYSGNTPTSSAFYVRLNPDASLASPPNDGFGRYRPLMNTTSALTLVTVPEPSTYAALLGLCAIALAVIRRRK